MECRRACLPCRAERQPVQHAAQPVITTHCNRQYQVQDKRRGSPYYVAVTARMKRLPAVQRCPYSTNYFCGFDCARHGYPRPRDNPSNTRRNQSLLRTVIDSARQTTQQPLPFCSYCSHETPTRCPTMSIFD